MNCPWCNNPVPQNRKGGHQKRYCDKDCSNAAWRASNRDYQKLRRIAARPASARPSRAAGESLADYPECKRVDRVKIPDQPGGFAWLYGQVDQFLAERLSPANPLQVERQQHRENILERYHEKKNHEASA